MIMTMIIEGMTSSSSSVHYGALVWRTWLQANGQNASPSTWRVAELAFTSAALGTMELLCVAILLRASWRLQPFENVELAAIPRVWRKGEQGQFSRLWSRRPSQRCQNCQKGEQGKIFENVEQQTIPLGLGKIDSIGAADNSNPLQILFHKFRCIYIRISIFSQLWNLFGLGPMFYL